MTILRIRYTKQGGHYHCRVFSSRGHGLTFAKLGDLVLDEQDFNDLSASLNSHETRHLIVEFKAEGEE